MFSVIFEVQPHDSRWDDYLAIAVGLRPELEGIDGFVDNIRYRSLTRPGWLLSLSGWRDEKSVVRWRTRGHHHAAQEAGRTAIFRDYHLRVGQVTEDTRLPSGQVLTAPGLDGTETGDATRITLIDTTAGAASSGPSAPEDNESAGGGAAGDGSEARARQLGWMPDAAGLVAWDVFEAVLTPGATILLLAWRDQDAADAFRSAARLPAQARLRQVRIVRDYGMRDRREAPQYFPDAP